MENNTKDRELRLTRLLNAPVELVWEVWTDPDHIANWWGPNGFTNTITTMDMRPGGEWNLVMHGPDGTDFKNRSIFKEVIPLKKIVYEYNLYRLSADTCILKDEGLASSVILLRR